MRCFSDRFNTLIFVPFLKQSMTRDEHYMARCLELARLGKADAAPNPMVGSVIVYQDRIIGEGYHERCGEAHAEPNAIASVKDKSLLRESTLYVSLEPCAHFGKTPPCASLIVQHQIPRVVVGCVDPFAKVAGRGIAMMREAGIEVEVGVLEQESLALNRRFITFHEKKRPYIILKWAESKDGFIDAEEDVPKWLTNEESRALVHKMRAEEMAIMVGTVAAYKDNPSLTTRAWAGKDPIRVTIDRSLRLPTTHHLFDGKVRTIVFTQEQREDRPNISFVSIDFSGDVLAQCLHYLHQQNINSLIVEGGEILLSSFIKQGLWDEAWQFIGPSTLRAGTAAPHLDHPIKDQMKVAGVTLNTYEA